MNPASRVLQYHPNIEPILKILLVGLLALLVITVAILAWVPPVSRDALTHHLAVPKLYIMHGGMVEIPHVPFSYYPMNLDLLYTIPLYLGNDIIPKFLHFAFALLTAGLLYSYIKRRLNTLYALIGALFFLSIPVIVKLSITVYVDLGLAFFATAALLYLLRWIESGFRFKYFVFSAVFCGLGLGTKYNGLVALFILLLFVSYGFIRSGASTRPKQIKAVGYGAAYFFIAMLVFSPWMIRNYSWTGNPVYPLYNNWFISSPAPPEKESDLELAAEIKERTGSWNHLSVRRLIFKESWAQIALIPLRIFFQGQDDKPQYFDGKLNPFLLLLPFFAFMKTGRKNPVFRIEKQLLLSFIILFVMIAFLRTSIRIRYIAPVIPPLIVLSIFGLRNMVSYFSDHRRTFIKRIGTALALATVLLMFYINTDYIVKQFGLVKPVDYISGRVEREEYITRYRPEYSVVKFANRHLTADARIMGLFMGNRFYYCDRTLIFGEALLKKTLIRAESAASVSRSLEEHGYTHLIIRFDLLEKWSTGLNEKEREILVEFLNRNLHLIYRKYGYGLFYLNHAAT